MANDALQSRLRHRIPTSLRQHWKLVVALAAAAVVLVAAFGDVRIRPYITGDTRVITSSVTENIAGTVDLFDDSVQYEVSVEIDEAQYQGMISAYENQGDKDWVTATVTIDGTVINDVGVRLKGNSTLMSLRGTDRMPDGVPGGGPRGERDGQRPANPEGISAPGVSETAQDAIPANGVDLPEGFTPPEGMDLPEGLTPPEGIGLPEGFTPPEGMGSPEGFAMPEGAETPEGSALPEGMELPEGFTPPTGGELPGGGEPGAGGPQIFGGGVSADEPNTLPLLLKFDKYADGRAYQGLTELSVRPGSPVLNEAMALSLTEATDQPSQRYAYTVYSVNGGDTATRLLLENPDAVYADTLFDADGYLYKADSSSRLEYVDEDQSSYSGQFKQINSSDSGSLQPVIDFTRWLDGASDEEFDAELDQWVDVESLARYLATQNLLVNTDDMTGPGQNYNLWYDLSTKKFTVVSWDLNLAMMSGSSTGPDDSVSLGGGAGGPGGMAPPGGMELPEGMGFPEGMTIPEGMSFPEGMGGAGDGSGGPGAFGGNQLAERFLDSEAFHSLYEQEYWQLFEQMYASGLADQLLDGLAASVPTSDGLTEDALQQDLDTMRQWIGERTAALEALRPA